MKTTVLESRAGYFEIAFTLNGAEKTFRAGESETLIELLRREGYTGTKKGCDTGDCGSCTVLVDGRAALSCMMLAVSAHGTSVETIEGLGGPADPHPIQQAYVDSGAVQCGFCIPGMILVTKELLAANPDPAEPEIRHALDGNICRCTGYVKQVHAVKLAARALKGKAGAKPKKRGENHGN
ncbi:MAG: (2Fe-2S)-binding protein [Elusimicrobiaceae bacterium]|nr:(2Fe-2S)-binding protein [Elusimicrobiaceae bacterium]